ncbi:hypothetical protein ACGVWS_09445 [Enterobacteriaceae bacterium LUAb1]
MLKGGFDIRTGEHTQLNGAAKASGRTGAQLLRNFMREFIKKEREAAEYDVWYHQKVEVGRAAVAEGRTISAEDVEAEAAEWRKSVLSKGNGSGS